MAIEKNLAMLMSPIDVLVEAIPKPNTGGLVQITKTEYAKCGRSSILRDLPAAHENK